jgi:hypothetical protein
MDFPLQMIGGKGKEKEQSVLRLGLKWTGLLSKVENAGLPTRPPGKMFRTDITRIPLALEQRGNTKLDDHLELAFKYVGRPA